MKEKAYAKINLCLDVKGRREDGYHELEMIMVPIDFYDILEIYPAEKTTLTNNREFIPANNKNTVIKAIEVLRSKYGFDTQFECRLQKSIPTRAGLAGGSADAAAAIRMIDRMLDLHMTLEEKIEAARLVGADVPFCIQSKPSFVKGIGETIMPFHCDPNFYVMLVKPRRGVSTKEAFEICDSTDPVHPDCRKMCESLMVNDYQGIVDSLGNSLEDAALQLVPEIRQVKEALTGLGFDGVLMSGSGSTVFGITKDEALVDRSMSLLREKKFFVRKTRILTNTRF